MTADPKPLADLLAEVDAAVARMTKGPWTRAPHVDGIVHTTTPHVVIAVHTEDEREHGAPDAAGIVALRNSWPRVSAELRMILLAVAR